MKAPAEVKETFIATIRIMDNDIKSKEDVLKGYEEVARETKESLKRMKQKRKEYFSLAKKFGITEENIGTFTPWDKNIPETLADPERNSVLAGIIDSWQSGDRNVQ